MDWGNGEYERTARQLEPAAQAAIDALHPHYGDRVLDVACGTGNAAVLAAQRGAEVAAIDESARLIEVAARRARIEALEVEFRVADMQDLPYEDDYFDCVISVFGVIFATDPVAAATELKRVTKPGGTIVLTVWLPRGPMAALISRSTKVVVEYAPHEGNLDRRLSWSDPSRLRALLGPDTEITEHQLTFKGSSPAAWILEQAEFHPAWMQMRDLMPKARYEQLLDELTELATKSNTDPGALSIASDYAIVRTRLHD